MFHAASEETPTTEDRWRGLDDPAHFLSIPYLRLFSPRGKHVAGGGWTLVSTGVSDT